MTDAPKIGAKEVCKERAQLDHTSLLEPRVSISSKGNELEEIPHIRHLSYQPPFRLFPHVTLHLRVVTLCRLLRYRDNLISYLQIYIDNTAQSEAEPHPVSRLRCEFGFPLGGKECLCVRSAQGVSRIRIMLL